MLGFDGGMRKCKGSCVEEDSLVAHAVKGQNIGDTVVNMYVKLSRKSTG